MTIKSRNTLLLTRATLDRAAKSVLTGTTADAVILITQAQSAIDDLLADDALRTAESDFLAALSGKKIYRKGDTV